MFVTCDVGDAMTIVHKSFYDPWDGEAAIAEETSVPCRDITVKVYNVTTNNSEQA